MPYNYARGRSLENRRESDKVRKIKASKTKWESSCSYSYTLCLDAIVLGLTEITFDPTVNDYVDVNVTR